MREVDDLEALIREKRAQRLVAEKLNDQLTAVLPATQYHAPPQSDLGELAHLRDLIHHLQRENDKLRSWNQNQAVVELQNEQLQREIQQLRSLIGLNDSAAVSRENELLLGENKKLGAELLAAKDAAARSAAETCTIQARCANELATLDQAQRDVEEERHRAGALQQQANALAFENGELGERVRTLRVMSGRQAQMIQERTHTPGELLRPASAGSGAAAVDAACAPSARAPGSQSQSGVYGVSHGVTHGVTHGSYGPMGLLGAQRPPSYSPTVLAAYPSIDVAASPQSPSPRRNAAPRHQAQHPPPSPSPSLHPAPLPAHGGGSPSVLDQMDYWERQRRREVEAVEASEVAVARAHAQAMATASVGGGAAAAGAGALAQQTRMATGAAGELGYEWGSHAAASNASCAVTVEELTSPCQPQPQLQQQQQQQPPPPPPPPPPLEQQQHARAAEAWAVADELEQRARSATVRKCVAGVECSPHPLCAGCCGSSEAT
jgi:hypothetical protein